MKNLLKYLIWGGAGFSAGLMVAQAIIAVAGRAGRAPGGELLIPLLLPLLVVAGYLAGRDTPRIDDYNRGYDEGWESALCSMDHMNYDDL